MELKTYRAHSMADALAEVKKDLGRDAVILHTRTYRSGGVMGLGARPIVEITASKDRPANARQPARSRAAAMAEVSAADRATAVVDDAPIVRTRETSAYLSGRVGAPAAEHARSDGIVPAAAGASAGVSGGAGRVAFEGFEPEAFPDARAPRPVPVVPRPEIPAGTEPAARAHAPLADPSANAVTAVPGGFSAATRSLATRVAPDPVDASTQKTLEEELRAIKRLVGHVLRAGKSNQPAGEMLGGAISMLYADLVEREVPPEIAESVCGEVRSALPPAEHDDATAVRSAALVRIASRLPVAQHDRTDAGEGRRRVIALVGPTGVGKTTTIAKLAASYKLRRGLRVGLVTSDTYRIAAVEQLRTYAGIIGLPLKVAVTPNDMRAAVDELSGCEVVLVDTAGRSQHDGVKLDELRAFLEAARPTERHLVLSAAASHAVIACAAERFGPAGCDRLLLTKIDEAVHHGALVHAAACSGLPLSFVSTGQEVPDHLEPAASERLARLVLGPRQQGEGVRA